MIAKEIRESILGLMGKTLDLLRVSPLEERQIRQIQTTLKNTFNADLVRLLESLEVQKVIKKCGCLVDLLACTDPKERRQFFDIRKECTKCLGVGYVDVKRGTTAKKKSE